MGKTNRKSGLFYLFIYLFIYLLSIWLHQVFVTTCGIQFPDQGLKPGPPALGARSLNLWTTREVPTGVILAVCTDPLQHRPPVSGDKNVLFLVQGGHLSLGKCMTCFQVDRGGQRVPPASSVSQVPSAQSNQCSKAAYSEVGCSEPFYLEGIFSQHLDLWPVMSPSEHQIC